MFLASAIIYKKATHEGRQQDTTMCGFSGTWVVLEIFEGQYKRQLTTFFQRNLFSLISKGLEIRDRD